MSEQEKTFPIMVERSAKPHPTRIPWPVAELAYSVYAGKYGTDQSLQRLAERGGLSPSEMDGFLPDWRELSSTVGALQAENKRLRGVVEKFEKTKDGVTVAPGMRLYNILDGRVAHWDVKVIAVGDKFNLWYSSIKALPGIPAREATPDA